MNSQQRENLRLLLLAALSAALPYAVTLGALRVGLGGAWRGLSDDELRAEIDYLVEKGFVACEGKAISPENKQWKITASGRDFLATEGLA